MTEIQFTIHGNPKFQKRHRTYTRGKGGKPLPFARQVDPSMTDKADMLAQIAQYRPETPWDGPIGLWVVWVVLRPASHFRTGKHASELRPDAPMWCAKKPDVDNYLKALLDCMSGMFFLDDAQVVFVQACKQYSPLPQFPRTDVILQRLQSGANHDPQTP